MSAVTYIVVSLGMIAWGLFLIKQGARRAINERGGRILRVNGYLLVIVGFLAFLWLGLLPLLVTSPEARHATGVTVREDSVMGPMFRVIGFLQLLLGGVFLIVWRRHHAQRDRLPDSARFQRLTLASLGFGLIAVGLFLIWKPLEFVRWWLS